MNELARPLALSALVVVTLLTYAGCAPEGARPCRSSQQCERGEECVFDDGDPNAEVGICLAALELPDAGVPDDGTGPDGGVPNTNGGVDGGARDGGRDDPDPDGGPSQNTSAVNDITVGGGFACARTYGNEAYCWGYNSNGQLGTPNTTSGIQQPTKVAGLSGVRAIAAGENHACAIGRFLGEEGVFCWGNSAEGDLGTPDGQTEGRPHRVPLDEEVHAVVVDLQTGARSTCVRTSTNEVWCWGPDVPGYTIGFPRKVTELSGAMRLHVSDGAICAKLMSGDVRCLDRQGIVGKLCDSAGATLQCPKLKDAESFHFTASNGCRIDGGDTVGALYCGGNNQYGVAHPSVLLNDDLAFTPLEEWLDYSSRQLSLGDQHACALGNDGVVRCWGRNVWSSTGQEDDVGELCANGNAICHGPEVVPDLPPMTDLDTYRFFTCAISDDGVPWCWGTLNTQTAERPGPWVIPR